MSWSISIPHRSRDESLVDVAAHARHLGQDESRITRQLVLQARLDGVATTAGELLDRLGRLEPAERRRLLDQAREACGLPSTADVEHQQRVADIVRSAQHAPTLQRCAIPDCTALPTNGLGVPIEVDARRWHCPAHAQLAQPGDLEPHGSGLRYSESGAIVPVDPADDQREAIAAERSRKQREAAQADRAVDAVAHDEHERAKREQLERELPEHLRRTAA